MSTASTQGLVDLAQPQHDLNTYAGRLFHFFNVTSPLTLFAPRSELLLAQDTVKKYNAEIQAQRLRPLLVPPEEREIFWKAQQLVQSSIHPDTGEPVLLPFRLSAFVPTNLIICAGMLMPNPSLRSVIFWQWANQSLNVGVNFANANKSMPMSMSEVGMAYVAACATSVGIAVSLTRVVPRLRFVSAGTRALLSQFVPFVSVATAGVVNISCMRWKEIRDGVEVYRLKQREEDGAAEKEVVGKSRIAGTMAVAQTAASRVATNIPTLIIPPLLMSRLNFSNTPRGRFLQNVTQLTVIGICLGVFLPPAVAIFPQQAVGNGKSLEKEFEHEGPLMFNKGL
ncbi:mitochondrion protein [Dacryopinax primogenitus]|uniref:Mitochondrion protein n=1 Tax=Dacryopinax primogenitus (strain DJM 731) TaxID=1858805 RepID=M5G120_DACPD|nr:mitochondrion protein [Dacryopinax primogenitus]EJU01850.1 mitochondrion protein [Dacryopinax primogenitus]